MNRYNLLSYVRGVVLSSIQDLELSLEYGKKVSVDYLSPTELIQCIKDRDEVGKLNLL